MYAAVPALAARQMRFYLRMHDHMCAGGTMYLIELQIILTNKLIAVSGHQQLALRLLAPDIIRIGLYIVCS